MSYDQADAIFRKNGFPVLLSDAAIQISRLEIADNFQCQTQYFAIVKYSSCSRRESVTIVKFVQEQ